MRLEKLRMCRKYDEDCVNVQIVIAMCNLSLFPTSNCNCVKFIDESFIESTFDCIKLSFCSTFHRDLCTTGQWSSVITSYFVHFVIVSDF